MRRFLQYSPKQYSCAPATENNMHTTLKLADYIKTDFAFWKKLVTDAGVNPN